MIGDWLYGLTQMEARTAPVIQRFNERATTTQNATGVSANGTPVPNDKYFLLLSATVLATPGAAQTCSTCNIGMTDPQNNNSFRLAIAAPAAAQALLAAQLTTAPVLFAPGERVTATATFNAGANPNTVSLDLVGLLIPKGNLQVR